MLDTICAVKSIIWGEPITAQHNCDPLNIYMGVRFRKPLTRLLFGCQAPTASTTEYGPKER